jgi:sulfur-carrier protein adenylyltransferase/sulfurtransferase
MELTKEELIRYNRHLILEDFGMEKQQRLRSGSILVVGAGGLGSPVLLYLAAAGVGRLGVVDSDNVEMSNLQRQVLFTETDIGRNKAEAARERLAERNHHVNIVPYPLRITSENALSIIADYDVVIDGSDNFPTRYLLNDACVLLNKPLVYGSVLRFEGHVSVFNVAGNEGFTANYRDLFPVPPDPEAVPSCEQAGVIGVLPGLVGCMQAAEAIKLLSGGGTPLVEKLLIIDSHTMEQQVISYRSRNARAGIEKLIDYDQFCGFSDAKNKSLGSNTITHMKEVTVQELKELMDKGEDFQLIDVREPYEFDICNIGGELIPQSEVPQNVEKINKEKQVIIHCRSGARSGNIIQWLETNHGYSNLYNLKGGILAWARDIDQDMPTY